jgi:large subunit ribosomal protein L10
LNRDQKAAVIDQVAADIEGADAVFAVDYRGMSVSQAAELRGRLRDADAGLRVVKNTLTHRAADKAGAEALKDMLQGPTALTFVRGDVAMAAKAIATFRRENDLPSFKGGTLGGETLSVEQLESIARLPAREQLQAQFVGVLASPITGLVRGLGALIGGLAVQLGAIRDQGLVAGDAPAAEPVDSGQSTADGGAGPAAEAEAPAAEAPAAEAETPAEEAPAAEAEAPAEEAPAAEAEAPAEEAPAAEEAEPAEAPGDPVAEAEAAEEQTSETPSEGDTEQEG